MEGIEISFPLAVCRDVLEDPESRQWRFYEASISPGKDKKKTLGSLRARVADSGVDQFVDLILTFPRNFIKCPAVRGKLRCRAEFVRSIPETDSTDQFSPPVSEAGKARLQRENESAADNQRKHWVKNKTCDKPRTLASVQGTVCTTAQAKQVSDTSTEAASNRPSRRREKPSKYKDYISTADPSKQTLKQVPVAADTQDTELSNHETGDSQLQSSGPDYFNRESDDKGSTVGTNQAEKRPEVTNLASEPPSKQKKRVVRKYDKLIKNLKQASAQSGLEMLSVITGYRSDVDSDLGETTSTGRSSETSNTHSEQKTNENPRSLQNTTVNTAQKSSRTAVGSEIDHVQRTGNIPDGAVSITATLGSIQSKTDENTVKTLSKLGPNPSHLTSFPRKFPSSLTRTDVLDVSLTKASGTGIRKRPSSHTEAVGEILSKYKKIQPAEKLTVCTSDEEYLDDDRDADYLPGKDEGESDSEDACDSDSEHESRKRYKKKAQCRQQQSNQPGSGSSGSSVLSARRLSSTGETASKTGAQNKAFELAPLPLSAIQQDTGKQHSAVLLGPFHVVSGHNHTGSPAALQLAPQSKNQGTPSIIHSSPASTPDTPAIKGSGSTNSSKASSGQVILPPSQVDNSSSADDGGLAHTPRPPLAIAVADHDYNGCAPGKKPLFSSRALKTLVRPISLAQHISARVERVEEGEGSSLVTISGLNTRAGWGTTPHNMHLSLKLNHEGLPIANSLEDAMTDTIKCREKHQQSYHLALTAEPSPVMHVDITDMPVLNEVVLTPSGHQHVNQRLSKVLGRGRPRKHPLLMTRTASSSTSSTETVEGRSDLHTVLEVTREEGDGGSGSVIVQMTQERSRQEKNTWGEDEGHGEQTDLQELVKQGLITASFLPGEAVAVDDLAVENEDEVKQPQVRPLRKFCKYCLRMFPASVILYKHVRTVHSAYAASEGYQEYLEALRRDNRIKCPFCPGQRTLANEYKLRAHIADIHHGQMDELGEVVDTVSHQCEVCQVHFHSLSELKAHATLLHNTNLFLCSQCPLAFVRDASLVVHVREAHGGIDPKSYQCKTCNSIFDNKRLLVFHKRNFHGRRIGRPKQETDETGGSGDGQTESPSVSQTKKSGRQASMASKGLKSAGNRSRCPCCLAGFSDLQQMQEHRRQTHSGPIPVHCAFCGMGYQSITPMYNHLRHHLLDDLGTSADDASLARCPYCDLVSTFTEALPLVVHMVETHRDKFPLACHVCKQCFISENLLLIHMGQAHEISRADAINSLPPNSPVSPPASSSSSPSISAGTLVKSETAYVGNHLLLPSKSAEESPTLLSVDSDILHSFPPEAQRRIRQIVQQGRRALLTIHNGKGGVQKVSFGKIQTQSLSATTKCPTSPVSPSTCCGQDTGEDLDEVVKEESVISGAASPVKEAVQSTEQSLVDGVNCAVKTDVPATTSGINIKTEGVTETSGVAEEMDIATQFSIITRESEPYPRTPDVKTETELYSGTSGIASEMEVVTGMLGVATEMVVVTGASDLTVTPSQIVLGEGMGDEEGALMPSEGETSTVDLSELATITVQTSDAQTLALSSDDLLKLIKDSQSAAGATQSD